MNRFVWTEGAKNDLRKLDREQALSILRHLTEYGFAGHGNVKQLKGSSDFRLRIGVIEFASSGSVMDACAFSRSATAKKPIAEAWGRWHP